MPNFPPAEGRNLDERFAMLFRRLERFGAIGEPERDALHRAFRTPRILRSRREIAQEGVSARECTVVLDGIAADCKVLDNGKRQILSLYVPGEICDLESFFAPVEAHALVALSPCTMTTITHDVLSDVVKRHPALLRRLTCELAAKHAILNQRIVSLGVRTAFGRMAHFLCEMKVRMDAVHGVSEAGFVLPVTQNDASDLLGLSSVHVSRTLQALRDAKLVETQRGAVTILSWEGLARAGDFDPAYLQIGALLTARVFPAS